MKKTKSSLNQYKWSSTKEEEIDGYNIKERLLKKYTPASISTKINIINGKTYKTKLKK